MGVNWQAGQEPIPGYRLIEKLGEGGFGEVWKAEAPGGFFVALKAVLLGGDAAKVELRALEIIRKVRHPQLIATFGTWQVDGKLIIAMELADKTLADRFREAAGQGFPGIPEPEVHEHFLDAARGLDYLNEPRHESKSGGLQGIQHRDIKPQNLLIIGGSVKVADYGLARILESTQTSHTGSMTPLYAAPEFFEAKTSSQSDQYSLAATYCHMRGGRPPFSGNLAEIMSGHMLREPDLSMLPEQERVAVGRALSKAPKNRWPSCRAFLEAVRNCSSADMKWSKPPREDSLPDEDVIRLEVEHEDVIKLDEDSFPDEDVIRLEVEVEDETRINIKDEIRSTTTPWKPNWPILSQARPSFSPTLLREKPPEPARNFGETTRQFFLSAAIGIVVCVPIVLTGLIYIVIPPADRKSASFYIGFYVGLTLLTICFELMCFLFYILARTVAKQVARAVHAVTGGGRSQGEGGGKEGRGRDEG